MVYTRHPNKNPAFCESRSPDNRWVCTEHWIDESGDSLHVATHSYTGTEESGQCLGVWDDEGWVFNGSDSVHRVLAKVEHMRFEISEEEIAERVRSLAQSVQELEHPTI